MEQIKKSGKTRSELATNIDFQGSLVRALIGVLFPGILLLIDYHLMIYAAPVAMYLFITAMIHFDVIKWAWLRWKKKPEPNMNMTWDEE
jgi:hypothetical protein